MPPTELLNHMAEQIDRIEAILTGNGSPEKGLVVKVDRLCQKYELWSKLIWVFVGGLPPLLAALVAYILKQGA